MMRRLAHPYARYRCSLVALAAIPAAGIITWAILSALNHQPLPAPLPIATEAAPLPHLVSPNQNPVTKLIVFADHTPAPPQSRWTAWLALAWLVGAVAMLGRAGVKVAGAERLRHACQPLDHPQIAQLVVEARRAIGLVRQIRVAVTDRLTSPAVVGVLVPTLILPLSLVTTLTPEQIRFILLHELAHIRRGDYFANLFQLFVETLLFFNPAVWWISHQVRREREACCDALAIKLSGAPADYARTLVHVAETVLSPTPASAAAFGGDREPSSLADRVQRLLVPGYRPSLRLTWRAMAAAFALGAVLLVLSAEGTRVAVAQITKPQPEAGKDASIDTITNGAASSNGISAMAEFVDRFAINDLVTVKFSGSIPDIPQHEERIKGHGTITLPLIGAVRAVDKTTVELQKAIHDRYVPAYYKRLSVVVTGEDSVSVGKGRVPMRQVYRGATSPVKASQSSGAFGKDLVPLSKLDQSPIEISGLTEHSRIEYDVAAGKTVATNGAIVRLKDQVLRADTVQFDQRNGNLIASGNVRVERPGATNETTRIELNIYSNQPPTRIPGERMIFTSEKRRAIADKLNQIRLERIGFDAVPLSDVVRAISADARRLDPEGRGVNIVINSNVPSPDDGKALDLGESKITINPPFENVRLADALDAILLRADKPLKLSIEDYAVVISLQGQEPTPLFMREFNLNLAVFTNRLAEKGYVFESPTNPTNIGAAIRGFFADAGIKLQPTNGRAIFYHDRKGLLLVRATMDELDKVESLVQSLQSQSPPAIGNAPVQNSSLVLFVRTFKVDPMTFLRGMESVVSDPAVRTNIQETVRAFFKTLGVELSPPKSVFYNDRAGELFVRATKEELDVIESALQVVNRPTPQINIKARFVEIGDQGDAAALFHQALGLTNVPANSTDSLGFTGILTDQQFRPLLRAIRQRNGVELLTEQEVTTLSGRQAQIQTVELKTVVNGVDLPVLPLPSNASTNHATNPVYHTQVLPFGPVLDVIPTVSEDGYTIHMTVIPTVTEFLGYDDPGSALPKHQAGSNEGVVLPLPRMRIRQLTTSAVVWDGQTLVLGIANDQLITKQASGGFLKEKNPDVEKKQLLVFITPTIIDPAGNRTNPDAESLPTRSRPPKQ